MAAADASQGTAGGGPGIVAALRGHPVLALAVLALVVRALFVVATGDYVPDFDAGDFDRHAVSIAAGEGFPESDLTAAGGPSAFRPPAYPYLLGAVYAVSGDSVTAGRMAGAVLGAVTVLLVGAVARRLFGEREAVFAALLAALLPPLVVWQTALLSESLFLALLCGLVLCLLEARERPEPIRWPAAAGALAGLATLTRSNGLLLVAIAGLAVWQLKPRLSARSAAAPAVLVTCAVLVVAPWSIRNTISFDRFVPTTTQSGLGVAGTYNEVARADPVEPGNWQPPQFLPIYAAVFDRADLDESELDRELREAGTDYARENPGYVVTASARNTARLLGVSSLPPIYFDAVSGYALGSLAEDLVRWSTVVLLALALAGAIVVLRARRGPPWFVWLMPLAMVASAVPISGDPRYGAPLQLFGVLFASAALAAASRARGTEGG